MTNATLDDFWLIYGTFCIAEILKSQAHSITLTDSEMTTVLTVIITFISARTAINLSLSFMVTFEKKCVLQQLIVYLQYQE